MIRRRQIVSLFCSACVLASCSTTQQTPPEVITSTSMEQTANTKSTEAVAAQPSATPTEAPVDTDTVDSLSKDVDRLQRDLIQYAGPLTPKQESEMESIKKKIEHKETKKAKLELQKMLGDWKEEE